jgi:hypothetical protein
VPPPEEGGDVDEVLSPNGAKEGPPGASVLNVVVEFPAAIVVFALFVSCFRVPNSPSAALQPPKRWAACRWRR